MESPAHQPNVVVVAVPPGDREETVAREFDWFVDLARTSKWTDVVVVFGWRWAKCFEGEEWAEMHMSLDELLDLVERLEDGDDGAIGRDDLDISPVGSGVTIRFCHEADVHITGPTTSMIVQAMRTRYESMGWKVSLKPAAD